MTYQELIKIVLREHPGPWRIQSGYSDHGSPYDSIEDANGINVFDGEFGRMSDSVFNLILNFPEILGER